MEVRIKRIDKTLPLPTYETSGSVAFDLTARQDTIIKKGEIGLVPSNVIIEVPKGHALFVLPRSSTPRKKGLLIPHGVGVIDQDYCGPRDEILIQLYNFSSKDALIERGEKIAQALLVSIAAASWQERDELKSESRGGFGSTDQNKITRN